MKRPPELISARQVSHPTKGIRGDRTSNLEKNMSNYLPLRLRVNPRRRKSRRSRSLRRRSLGRRRSNPAGSRKIGSIVKKTFTRGNLMPIAGLTLGFLGGSVVANKARGWIAEQTWSGADTASKWVGLLNLILGAAVSVKGKGVLVKSSGAGVALSGAYDLVAVNVPSLALPNISPAMPGLPGAGATTVKGMELGWIGTRVRNRSAASSMAGVELDGDNEDSSAI